MNESEHLWELCVESADPQANVAGLSNHELRLLMVHVQHIIKRGGSGGGVPSLVLGLCELEAAERFLKEVGR